MTEEWRAVPGWEGLYEISDQGRVRSLGRTGFMSDGRALVKKPRMLTPSLDRKGYQRVTLTGSRRWKAGIHQLVLLAFVGPRAEGHEARHLDDDKDNNRLTNLAYGTSSENRRDAVRNGVHGQARKTSCPRGHAYDYTKPNGSRVCRKCKALHRSVNPVFLRKEEAA